MNRSAKTSRNHSVVTLHAFEEGLKLRFTGLARIAGIAGAVALFSGCASNSLHFARAPGPGLNTPLFSEGEYLGRPSPQEVQRNQEDRTTTWMEPIDEKARLTYVSDCGSNDVTVYDSNARVVGEIGGLDCPLGLFVDHHGDLWVANSGEQDVLEFARSGTTPIKTLTNARAIPNDVTICPDDTLYVSNFGTDIEDGDIAVYPPGKTKPTRTLKSLGVNSNNWVTCDSSGNVLSMVIFGSQLTEVGVIEYPLGRRAHQQTLPLYYIAYPGGIKADPSGDLLISDGTSVTEYTEAGAPTGKSVLTPPYFQDVAVTKDGLLLGGTGRHIARSWAFPGGGERHNYRNVNPPSTSVPTGFAFDPGYP